MFIAALYYKRFGKGFHWGCVMKFRQIIISFIVVAFLVPWIPTPFVSTAYAAEDSECRPRFLNLKEIKPGEDPTVSYISISRDHRDGEIVEVVTEYVPFKGLYDCGPTAIVFVHPDLLRVPDGGERADTLLNWQVVCNQPATIDGGTVIVPFMSLRVNSYYFDYYEGTKDDYHRSLEIYGPIEKLDGGPMKRIRIILTRSDFTRDKEPDSKFNCALPTSLPGEQEGPTALDSVSDPATTGDQGGTVDTVSDTGTTTEGTIGTFETDVLLQTTTDSTGEKTKQNKGKGKKK